MRLVQRARKRAQEVLDRHGVAGPPVDVKSIAESYARLVESSLGEVSGALVPLEQSRWAILVNSDHHANRQRFTIAHELGHLLIHQYTTPHADRTFKFRNARSSQGTAMEEIEANQFAAELLMPTHLILEAVADKTFDHGGVDGGEDFDATVMELADLFKVSKEAMSIRLSSLFY